VCAVVFRDFLSLHRVYLFTDIGSDTVNAFYPRLVHVADYLRRWGLPRWSFQQGMGQSIFPWDLGDPFNWVLLALGRDRLPFGIAYMEVAKILLACVLFHRTLAWTGLSPLARAVGALGFAFSGFMVVGGTWYVFSTEGVYLALVLLAFERGFTRGTWGLLPVAFACIGLTRPFALYTHGLFLGVYALLRQAETHGLAWRPLAALWGRLAGMAVLGSAMSAVFLGSQLFTMLQSPRVAGQASHTQLLAQRPLLPTGGLQAGTALARLFGNDLLGTGNHFTGWHNYLAAPLFYTGLPTLLLAPLAFPLLPRRPRMVFGVVFAACALVVAFPFLRHAFWLFTGDYYRGLSFMVGVLLLLAAARALDRIDRGARPHPSCVAGTLAVLLAALCLLPSPPGAPPLLPTRLPISLCLVGYAGLVIWLGRVSSAARGPRWAFVLLMCLELGYAADPAVARRPVLTAADLAARTGYNDDSMTAAAFLARADTGFYRVDKPWGSGPAAHVSLNDALVQGFRGTRSYNNFNQIHYIRFQAAMGVLDPANDDATRWTPGLLARPLLETLCGVKYRLARVGIPDSPLVDMVYGPKATFGNVRVLENRLYLPIGFAYDHYLARAVLDRLSPASKDIALLHAVVPDDPAEAKAHGLTLLTPGPTLAIGPAIAARRAEALIVTAHTPNRIEGTVAVGGPRLLFLSIPFDPGWSARVDGRPVPLEPVDGGLTGLYLDKGRHRVALAYHVPYLGAALGISAVATALWAYWFLLRRRPPP